MKQNTNNQMRRKRPIKKRKKSKNKGLGISTFLYLIIFCYLILNIISFCRHNDVNYISAESGNIYKAQIFEGIILRNETVVKSEYSGIANFYVPEGDKTNIDSLVCTIDSNGEFTNEIKRNLKYVNEKLAYSNNLNTHQTIKNNLYTYAINYNSSSFNNVYEFKTNLNDTLSNIISSLYIIDLDALRNKNLLESQVSNNVNLVKAFKSGVISYKIDGYEQFDTNKLDIKELFDYKSEEIYTYKTESVKKDTPLFKIVNNDKWYIISEMNKELSRYIEDKEHLKINIINKDTTINSKITDIIERGNKKYIILEVDGYYSILKERKIKFQVIYQQYNGIKIPKTAILEKEFIDIPKKYITYKGNSKGILKKTYGEKYAGGESVEFIKIGINYMDTDNCYVPISKKGLQINDIVVDSTNNNFTLKEKKSLKGVYVINKGYSSFRFIEEIYNSGRYVIVKSNTPYGIRIYDRVITDSSIAKEDVILE